MSGRISSGVFGRPLRGLDFQCQCARKPARCQRITVSGLTIFKASSTPGASRYNPANTRRSMLVKVRSLRRFTSAHVELMTKRQDLCLQRRSRPEQSDQRQANQPANISHQPRTSPDSTSFASRIEFPTMTPELEKRGSEECSMECIAEVQVAFVSAVTFEPFHALEPSSSFSLPTLCFRD